MITPNAKELSDLQKIYAKAEADIINEVARLRSRGLVDYHATAALERVNKILNRMKAESEKQVPLMVEKMFYTRVPEAYTRLRQQGIHGMKSPEAHKAGYMKATRLTSEQSEVVKALVRSMNMEVEQMANTALNDLSQYLVGRRYDDIFTTAGKAAIAQMQAQNGGVLPAANNFVEELRLHGVTCFKDKAGRSWNIHNYAAMVSRTTSRQAEVMAVLTADPEQDLYIIKKNGTTCELCAPYEGRVYSRSGKNKDFPPLADAFGKIDIHGGNSLNNTWLNIHPNCKHALVPWTPAGRSAEEIDRIKRFSDPTTNPYSRDPRSQKQIEAYRNQQAGRAEYLRQLHEWQDMTAAGTPGVPKNFETFQRHRKDKDDNYSRWRAAYKGLTEA